MFISPLITLVFIRFVVMVFAFTTFCVSTHVIRLSQSSRRVVWTALLCAVVTYTSISVATAHYFGASVSTVAARVIPRVALYRIIPYALYRVLRSALYRVFCGVTPCRLCRVLRYTALYKVCVIPRVVDAVFILPFWGVIGRSWIATLLCCWVHSARTISVLKTGFWYEATATPVDTKVMKIEFWRWWDDGSYARALVVLMVNSTMKHLYLGRA